MVTDAVLDLVVLSPANPVIVYPPWLQLTASGVYSDGSTQDLTASVTWTSAAPTTASISSSGLATSIDPGTSTITATLGTKSGNALLTVMTEPVGSVTSVSNISCTAGGVSGGSCYSLNVSCPAVADQNVLVKMAPPAGAPKGTIIFIGGGGSNGFFDTGYAYGSFIDGAESLAPFKEAFDPAVANDPDVQEYFGAVQRYFPNQAKALDVYTEAQWVAAKVFVEGLKRIPGAVTRQSLVAALNTLKDFKPGLIPSVSYGPGNHDPNHCYRFMQHDGKTADNGGTWHTVSDWNCY